MIRTDEKWPGPGRQIRETWLKASGKMFLPCSAFKSTDSLFSFFFCARDTDRQTEGVDLTSKKFTVQWLSQTKRKILGKTLAEC